MDAADPSQKRQLTFGESNDIMPVFGRDPHTIHLASDRWGGIFNICRLDTSTLELGRLTDLVGGGFSPVQLADRDGKPQLAYVGYSEGTFRLYRMEEKEPAVSVSAEEPTGAPETLAYHPELELTLDQAEKRPYKKKWSIDAPVIGIGAASDGTIFTNVAVNFADLLGDYRINLLLDTVSTYSNINVTYLNMKRRLQWGVSVFDNRDFFAVTVPGEANLQRQDSRVTGAFALAQYPLNRYYRVEGQAGYVYRSETYPVAVNAGGYTFVDYAHYVDSFGVVSLAFSGDTTRFKEFGAYQGKRFSLAVYDAMQISGDTGSVVNYSLDYRGYGHVTRRSLFAWRLFGLFSTGDGAGVYSIGGYNDLRGYDFREFFGNRVGFTNIEFRFPLIDELRFPFGSLRNLRGNFFLDVGSAYFNNGAFFSQNLGDYRSYGPFIDTNGDGTVDVYQPNQYLKFKAWDSENNRLGDLRASWGLGFNFFFGGLEWHWDFAHQLPYTDYERVCVTASGKVANCANLNVIAATRLDPIEVSNTGIRTNFWIGYSF